MSDGHEKGGRDSDRPGSKLGAAGPLAADAAADAAAAAGTGTEDGEVDVVWTPSASMGEVWIMDG
jgi:hypothetical protein